MYLLPDFGTGPGESLTYSKSEAIGIIVMAYSMILTFILLLGLCLYNFYKFLYKQGKWKVTPILVFYIVGLLIILFRIFDYIFVA